MNSPTRNAVLIALVGLGAVYIALFYVAGDGFGHAGYRGYSSRPWFRGGVETYHDRSARTGSAGGLGIVGGGPEGGK
ncbi:hypothetical protein ASC89_27505 [Devosia sp. Root413D1]|uniref:hypothetical protein n=1 Tax=Devosia sp. Root413D1 TaxID=1736531 RepID=UPI0006F320C8|nr:hypothetical protein [Devosia sp. Root413D1]KQW83496.1 hypothetical protein ASC89_27505 [Devosia sp. Root413D1]